MDQIIVNETQIKKVGTEIINYASQLDSEIDKLIGCVDNIISTWDGNDAKAYIDIMRTSYIPALQSLQACINTYGTYLQEVPETYSTLDEVFGNKNIEV